jgi:hypothetical protein
VGYRFGRADLTESAIGLATEGWRGGRRRRDRIATRGIVRVSLVAARCETGRSGSLGARVAMDAGLRRSRASAPHGASESGLRAYQMAVSATRFRPSLLGAGLIALSADFDAE